MIEVRGLVKRFGSTVAVDDLSFDVRPGVVTGFLGPNGAGKSTTMRLMLGLDHAERGEARFDGRRYVDLPNPVREVGALLDASYLHPSRSARNHLRAVATMAGIPRRRVDEVLEAVGLAEAANRKAGGFSLGMKQRLGLATALLGDPQTLILDEPANGLDPEGILWTRQFLRWLAGQGRTVFVSSHILAEMAQMADEVVVIGRGRLIASGPVKDLVAASASSVRVRSPGADRLAGLLREEGATVTVAADGALTVTGADAPSVGELAARHGVVLHELVTVEATLEDAFLELTRNATEYRAAAPGGGAR